MTEAHSTHTVELEKRFKVLDRRAMDMKLGALGIEMLRVNRVKDYWFIPGSIQSYEEQEDYFNNRLGSVYRIRRTRQSDGNYTTELIMKRLKTAGDHSLQEETIVKGVHAHEDALGWLAEHRQNWRNWLILDKERTAYVTADNNLAVVMDTVAGLAEHLGYESALEIEYEGSGSELEGVDAIAQFADNLIAVGALNREDELDRGLPVLAAKFMADFKRPPIAKGA